MCAKILADAMTFPTGRGGLTYLNQILKRRTSGQKDLNGFGHNLSFRFRNLYSIEKLHGGEGGRVMARNVWVKKVGLQI